MIHIRVTDEDLKKLDELASEDNPFNSRARVVRELIRNAWKNKHNLATAEK
jgi:Arc/MetJ-type ribon-helix-helix transcriptional regulator